MAESWPVRAALVSAFVNSERRTRGWMIGNDYSNLPATRAAAVKSGSVHYYTGKPCPKGHIAPRFTSSFGCVICSQRRPRDVARRNEARYRAKNQALINEKGRIGRSEDPERYRTYGRRWRAKNPEMVIQASRDAYRRDPKGAASRLRRRRARLMAAEGSHTAADVEAINRSQDFKCAICFT